MANYNTERFGSRPANYGLPPGLEELISSSSSSRRSPLHECGNLSKEGGGGGEEVNGSLLPLHMDDQPPEDQLTVTRGGEQPQDTVALGKDNDGERRTEEENEDAQPQQEKCEEDDESLPSVPVRRSANAWSAGYGGHPVYAQGQGRSLPNGSAYRDNNGWDRFRTALQLQQQESQQSGGGERLTTRPFDGPPKGLLTTSAVGFGRPPSKNGSSPSSQSHRHSSPGKSTTSSRDSCEWERPQRREEEEEEERRWRGRNEEFPHSQGSRRSSNADRDLYDDRVSEQRRRRGSEERRRRPIRHRSPSEEEDLYEDVYGTSTTSKMTSMSRRRGEGSGPSSPAPRPFDGRAKGLPAPPPPATNATAVAADATALFGPPPTYEEACKAPALTDDAQGYGIASPPQGRRAPNNERAMREEVIASSRRGREENDNFQRSERYDSRGDETRRSSYEREAYGSHHRREPRSEEYRSPHEDYRSRRPARSPPVREEEEYRSPSPPATPPRDNYRGNVRVDSHREEERGERRASRHSSGSSSYSSSFASEVRRNNVGASSRNGGEGGGEGGGVNNAKHFDRERLCHLLFMVRDIVQDSDILKLIKRYDAVSYLELTEGLARVRCAEEEMQAAETELTRSERNTVAMAPASNNASSSRSGQGWREDNSRRTRSPYDDGPRRQRF